MKIVNRSLGDSADASAASHSAVKELCRLLLYVTILALSVYFLVCVSVDFVVSKISFESESKMFPEKLRGAMVKTESSEETERLESILNTFLVDERVPPLPYKIGVLKSSEINAYAFPGGTIGVTKGLLSALDKDIELAFVIGHELGHFKNRDHLRGIGRTVGVTVVYAVIFGGEMGSKSIGKYYHYVLARDYSREQESRADRFGIDLVFSVYGETAGTEKLFELLQQRDKTPEWAYMFSTHPSAKERIAELKRYAEQLRDGEGKSRRSVSCEL